MQISPLTYPCTWWNFGSSLLVTAMLIGSHDPVPPESLCITSQGEDPASFFQDSHTTVKWGGGAQTHTSGDVRDWGSSIREAAIPRTLPLETCVFRCLWQSGDIYGPVSKKLSKVYNKMYKITKDTIVLESSYQNHFKMCTFINVYFSEGKLSYKIYISLICIICYINVLEYPPMKYA